MVLPSCIVPLCSKVQSPEGESSQAKSSRRRSLTSHRLLFLPLNFPLSVTTRVSLKELINHQKSSTRLAKASALAMLTSSPSRAQSVAFMLADFVGLVSSEPPTNFWLLDFSLTLFSILLSASHDVSSLNRFDKSLERSTRQRCTPSSNV